MAETKTKDELRLETIRVFEAVYEGGVLKLIGDSRLPENHRFSVQVQELREPDADSVLAGWHRVYEGLSDEEVAEVEAVALDRSRFSRNLPE